MKINKIFLFGVMALSSLFMASCGSDDDDYTPGQPAGSYNVTFADESTQVMALSANTFDITLKRTDTSGSLTVPITKLSAPDFLTVPESATFAAGEETTTITATVSDEIALNTSYSLRLQIPEEYTNPYLDQETAPTCNITFLKEDYEPFADGIFYDNFWFEDKWEAFMEYSPSQDLYRMKGLWYEGYDFFFKIAEDGSITFTNSAGEAQATSEMGYIHPSYGMVSVRQTTASGYYSMYDSSEGVFYFVWQFRVSAGSFGVGLDYFVVTKYYN